MHDIYFYIFLVEDKDKQTCSAKFAACQCNMLRTALDTVPAMAEFLREKMGRNACKKESVRTRDFSVVQNTNL